MVPWMDGIGGQSLRETTVCACLSVKQAKSLDLKARGRDLWCCQGDAFNGSVAAATPAVAEGLADDRHELPDISRPAQGQLEDAVACVIANLGQGVERGFVAELFELTNEAVLVRLTALGQREVVGPETLVRRVARAQVVADDEDGAGYGTDRLLWPRRPLRVAWR